MSTWSVKYPLSIIVGGDTKQSGFTKVKDEFTSIYSDLSTHAHDGTADNGDKISAANITNVAAGNIVATDVQAAINELDTEKLSSTGGTLTGLLIEKKGADIASAATINLSTATGNFVHVTGTTPITAVTMTSGQRMTVIFDGALTLTHHATNNNLPGGANITTAAGDRATYWSDGTTVYCTKYTPYNFAILPKWDFANLKITNGGTPNSQVAVTADSETYFNSAVSLTISTGSTGANALDTGAVAQNTWYSVWVIAKTDGTVAGLLSTSATAPTMPAGYTLKKRVGWVKTDNTADKYLLRTLQYGNKAQYVVAAATNTANMPLMTSGAQGDITIPTWVAISVSSFVPSTATKIIVVGKNIHGSGALMVSPNNGYGPYDSTTNSPPMVACGVSGFYNVLQCEFVLESTNIYYASSVANTFLWCEGWEDNI